MAELSVPTPDRRRGGGADRRRQPRNGRRAGDPHVEWRWRQLAWLFAGSAVYLSLRALPASVKKFFERTPVAP